ncbi:hypothetical protein HY448_01995, partial [Candidatus Pacearchaeota archaeon]|nr:hypothetical protein [Candidatus Pacearchaeota archaeon]
MNKRGTHVGFVISFVMFVTFLLFLNTFLISPTISKESKKNAIEELKIKIIENVSQEVKSTSLKLNHNTGNKCVKLENFLPLTGFGNNLVAKDPQGNRQDTYVDGNYLEIDRVSSEIVFFNVYYSRGFANLSSKSGCAAINQGQYVLGSVSKQKHVSKNKVNELLNYYNLDYEAVKNSLSISDEDEFSFSFEDKNRTVASTKKQNLTINVYALEIPVQYFENNG